MGNFKSSFMVPIEVPIHKYFTEPQNYNPVLFFLCFVFLCTGKVLLVRFLASACSDDSCVVIMMGYDGVCYVRDKHVAAPMIRLCVLAYGFLYNSDLYR